MSYSKTEFPKLMQTAGKITVLTALTGVMVFVVAFLFDAGSHQLGRMVNATSTASTTLTVLNTPPAFTQNPYEVIESSTSTPTNSGSVQQWRATAVDSNGAPYFLLVCQSNSPAPIATNSTTTLGTAKPNCGAGVTRWGVSASTVSGVAATVSTTTLEGGSFSTSSPNVWYAYVCDDDPINARCNTTGLQGTGSSATSSPFHINSRPVLTSFNNNGPTNPGAVITFTSVSSDPDALGGQDNIYLIVCENNSGINATTRACTSGTTLATTTGSVTDNATALRTLAAIMQDQGYAAYGYIVDQHAHTATANPINQNYTVSNVAPTLLGGDISLNGGSSLILSVPADETTGYTLAFTVRDANSCDAVGGGAADEITAYRVAVYRALTGTYSTSTCTGLSATYNANRCYVGGEGGVSTGVWNLSCTASSTSCAGAADDTIIYNCTFPLWFIADPTDAGPNTPTLYEQSNWKAAVQAKDDDLAWSSLQNGSIAVELISFTALDLITAQIPYGSLEPGQTSGGGILTATTTVYSVGNTGLDQKVSGESMCSTFAIGNECRISATSTVPEYVQKFSSSTLSYVSGAALTLSSTTIKEVELNVNKTTSTSTYESGDTFFGIQVPAAITLAGVYRGLNYFDAKVAEAIDW